MSDSKPKTSAAAYIKGGFVLLKSQVMAAILSFFLYAVAFMFLKVNSIWMVLYSIVSTLACFLFVYADAYRLAENDLKPQSGAKIFPLKGWVFSLVPFAVTALITLLWQLIYLSPIQDNIATSSAASNIFLIMQTVFVGYTFPFRGFMNIADNHINWWAYLFIFLWPMMSAVVGYFAGLKKFSIYQKIIYPFLYKKKKDQ